MKHRYNKPYSNRPPWANNSYYRGGGANGSRSFSPPRRRWPPSSSSSSSRPPTTTPPASSKRKNENGNYPESKRSKTKGIQVLVTSIDFPSKHLTEDQLGKLQTAILNEITKISADDFCPQFLDSFQRRGNLIVMCNNQESVDWLKNIISTLKPWENAEFKALEPTELPNLVDIMVQVPQDVEVEVFLRRIDKQNDDLNATTWNLTGTKKDEETKTNIFTFTVNEQIGDTLRKLNLKIFFNFSRINIKYLGSLKPKVDKKEEDKKDDDKKEDDKKLEETDENNVNKEDTEIKQESEVKQEETTEETTENNV